MSERAQQTIFVAAFPAPEAHRVLRRLEFHYTPKHASWLNLVEIEIGVLRGQCLDRCIGARATASSPKLPPGNSSATPPAPASPGCSPPSALAPKWPALTPTLPKCHNPCAEVLEQYGLLSVEEKQVLESAPSSQRQYEADRD